MIPTKKFGCGLSTTSHGWTKRRTDRIFAKYFCNVVKQMKTSQTWLLLAFRCVTVGTVSKQSIRLHSGSQNHTKARQKRNREDQTRIAFSVFSVTVKVWWIISSFLEVKKWISSYIRPFQVTYEKQCERNDQSSGKAPGSLTTTQPQRRRRCLSRSFSGEKQNSCGFTPIQQPWTVSIILFLFQNLEIIL
jgi:hypothetical protein